MSIKKWLSDRGKPKEPEPIIVDDLIILEQWNEAEKFLKDRLKKSSGDLQARLKLAEVYERTSRPREAVEEYSWVADRYASEGYFDKAIAMLTKATRMAPMEATLQLKMQRVQRMRKFDQRLAKVMKSLSALDGQKGATATTSYLELRRVWGELAVSDLMDHLDNDQLGRLLQVMELVKVGRDKTIVEKGQHLEELYLITRGNVEVQLELPNGETTVIRGLEPGDVVGDRALLEQTAWAATLQTTEPVVLLKLSRPSLENILQGNPDPRGLLDALREQRLDSEIATAVEKTLRD